ncbi:MAG TPA: TonB-dependent receptor, partial [Stenotrophomonas sp.]|nr:TonB-dependent receptor [Stenotrophomonas sp.]
TYGTANLGKMETEGYDLELSHHLDTRHGKLSTGWTTTYVSSYLERTTNDADVVPETKNGIGSGFRVRSNLTLGWDLGDFGISWTARYYSGVKEQCLSLPNHPDECSDPGVYAPWYKGARNYNERGSVTFHDVQARYKLPWNATVSIGANNVFNRLGPVMYTKPNSVYSYYGGFDIGRFVYMQYKQQF